MTRPELRRAFEGTPIGRLALSVQPRAPSEQKFLILTGYYDESGTHGGSPATVLAGFLASTETWVGFETDWSAILEKYEIKYVRAKELLHREGECRFSKPKADALLRELINSFSGRDMLAQYTSLHEIDYQAHYIGSGPIKGERFDTRYALVFRSFLFSDSMTAFYRVGGDTTTNLVLEIGHKNAGDANRVFEEFIKETKYPWRNPVIRGDALSFKSKEGTPALQAADLLAHFAFRAERNKLAGKMEQYDHSNPLPGFPLPIGYHSITRNNLADLRSEMVRRSEARIASRALKASRAQSS